MANYAYSSYTSSTSAGDQFWWTYNGQTYTGQSFQIIPEPVPLFIDRKLNDAILAAWRRMTGVSQSPLTIDVEKIEVKKPKRKRSPRIKPKKEYRHIELPD